MPGRKTDVADAVVAGPAVRVRAAAAQLRAAAGDRAAAGPDPLPQEADRGTGPGDPAIQKLLEDAGIKLDSVVSDILGVSARQMLEALIAGVRDVAALAELAHTRMRPKIPQLRQALEGRFAAHHALMLRMHLDHIDQLSATSSGSTSRSTG